MAPVSIIARLAALLCVLAAGSAAAEGFAVKDLRDLAVDASGFDGGSYSAEATAAGRLTVFCDDCAELAAVDVLLGRSEDGTEERYRSGETTIEQMAALCQARAPSCELRAAEVGAAVGWITEYAIGGMRGSTVVLFLDGDLLTIRSVAPSQGLASANARHALEAIAPSIVGAP